MFSENWANAANRLCSCQYCKAAKTATIIRLMQAVIVPLSPCQNIREMKRICLKGSAMVQVSECKLGSYLLC